MLKSDFAKFLEIENSEINRCLISAYISNYLSIKDKLYILVEDVSYLADLKENHKAYIIKGTDWPYWFKLFDGRYVHSNTSN